MELVPLEGKKQGGVPVDTAEMLLEPLSAIEIARMAPVTMNMVASVTMNEGSGVRTTMKPLTRPTRMPAA